MSISSVGGYGGYQVQQQFGVRGGGGADFASRLAELDVNGDGGLDVSESSLAQDVFTKMDSDSDGLLTYADLKSRMRSQSGQGEGPGGMGGPGGAPPSAEEMISGLDSDGDGELSSEEFQIDSAMFSEIDADGSGSLSQAELEAHQAAMEAQRAAMGEDGQGMAPPPPPSADDLMASLDSDGDGGISQDEAQVDSSTFSSIDSNGDGTISQSELEAYLASQGQERQDASQANATSGMSGMRGMAPPGPPPSAEDLLAELDSDGDGELSATEFQIDSAMFSEIDSDGDGSLSQAELEAHQAAREAKRAAREEQTAQTQTSDQSDLIRQLANSYQYQYGMNAYQTQSGISPWMAASYGASSGVSLTA